MPADFLSDTWSALSLGNESTVAIVREDGWMSASVCLNGPVSTTRKSPLTLRYLLHAHRGDVDPGRAATIAKDFAGRPGYRVVKGKQQHHQFSLERVTAGPLP